MSGYRETQDALENISSIKSELDSMKGRTLEDISYMVQQLNTKITAKKTALAPIIKELRPLRQRAAVSEIEQPLVSIKMNTNTMILFYWKSLFVLGTDV